MEFVGRVLGAMGMDASTHEAIEADPGAYRQSVVVVGAFGVAAVDHLGIRVFPEPQTHSDIREIARTVGFSAAPGLLLALLTFPVGRPVTFALVSLWM